MLYKGHPVGDLRLDLLVASEVIVEVKSVERLAPIFEAQIPLTCVSRTNTWDS